MAANADDVWILGITMTKFGKHTAASRPTVSSHATRAAGSQYWRGSASS